MKTFKIIMLSALVSAIIMAGSIWYYDNHYATKIAVIDMTGYVARLKKAYLAGNLSKEELETKLKRLSHLIRSNHAPNAVMLLKEVVVSGKVQDFSPDLSASGFIRRSSGGVANSQAE